MKGAAFTAACMCQAQKNPTIDMLMYYDAAGDAQPFADVVIVYVPFTIVPKFSITSIYCAAEFAFGIML